MVVINWLRMVIGISLLLLSATVFTIEVIGVFKMKYSLNRMHSAAMGDTMGLLSGLVGLMILSGFNFATLKMVLVLVFLWCTSPVASHLIARMEYSTFDQIAERAEFCDLTEDVEGEADPDESEYSDAASAPDETVYNKANPAAASEKPDDLSEMLARF